MKSSLCSLTLSVALLLPSAFAEPPTTKPATQPATQPAARKLEAKISPEARAVLDEMKSAYAGLKSLQLTGTTAFDSEISGKKDHQSDTFTASFAAPNKFRHEMKGNMIAGSTGEKMYVLSVEDNAYVQKDAPKDRVNPGEAPKAIWDVVGLQNPSLAMALSRDAAGALVDGATSFAVGSSKEKSAAEVEKGTELQKIGDVKIGDKSCTALKLTNAVGEFIFLVDPQSHLLRRVTIDQTEFLKHLGQPDVKAATITVDYVTTVVDAKPADGQVEDQFTWSPPAGARELTAAMAGREAGDDPAAALMGKPAPDFKLKDLTGAEVVLSEQKGNVVIVDFWATWCPPCVEALPHLNKLYQDKKAAGLKVLAVSVDQDKSKVAPFVADKKLLFTVLLDTNEEKAAEKFGVQGIPQTVIIGKDGVVKKVFVGFGPGTEDEMRKVVEDAMK